jgi:16S rRNA (guanine966-N2)-methyltransferase
MRVIAGMFRSRRLVAPPGSATRPTSDRLRETLFNVVAPAAPGSVWLDLYAGSGAVGIEAVSRGASMCHFVEQSRTALKSLHVNLRELGLENRTVVHERDVTQALRALDATGARFDFCFLDPPYDADKAYSDTLKQLAQSRILSADSIVIAEHEKHFELDEKYGELTRYRALKQGDAVLSFYRKSS